MALLEVEDIHTFYGNIEALKGVSLEVEEGECVTLIGSNGAGKSTTLRSISGLTPPRAGSIRFRGKRIYETIAEINQQGTTILLVEQNANFALGVSRRGYVLETGKVALTNESAKLREDPEVQRAYLGT